MKTAKPRILRAPATLVRRALIRSGLDQTLAEATYRRPHGLMTRLFRPDIDDYAGTRPRRATRDSVHYDLDLGDYVQWTIYFGVERAEKTALFKLAQPGQTVLDVGTNVGEVLLNLAKRVGSTGRVIGFEPNPETLAKCRHNLSLNPCENVEVHEVALGEKADDVLLGRPSDTNAGADRIVSSGASGITVHVTTLDTFAAEHELSRVDLVKIDVEGYDLKVLRGAERTIDEWRPLLFVELSDSNLRQQGDSARALVEWLEARRYHVLDAITRKMITASDNLADCFTDIVALPA